MFAIKLQAHKIFTSSVCKYWILCKKKNPNFTRHNQLASIYIQAYGLHYLQHSQQQSGVPRTTSLDCFTLLFLCSPAVHASTSTPVTFISILYTPNSCFFTTHGSNCLLPHTPFSENLFCRLHLNLSLNFSPIIKYVLLAFLEIFLIIPRTFPVVL